MSGNLEDLGFDAQNVEPNSFDILPAGDYQAAIVDSVVQGTKAGDGKYLALELQILDGPARGRKLFDRLNLWNRSAKATEIARATLSSICRAVGVLTPKHSAELHDKPLVVKVVQKNDSQYGPKNEVAAYKPLGDRRAAPLASPPTLPVQTRTPVDDDDSIPF